MTSISRICYLHAKTTAPTSDYSCGQYVQKSSSYSLRKVINKKQAILGGVSGVTFYGSLYVDSLWIDKTMRHQGWGIKLMHEAEKIGIERGAKFVTLNTMDWEGLPFYQKLGYAIEFVREGYNENSKMFMLRKTL